MLKIILIIITTIILSIICISFFTVLERKFISSIQRRRGPNVVGVWGFFQAIADGLKLAMTDVNIPNKAYRILFVLAPLWSFALSLSS